VTPVPAPRFLSTRTDRERLLELSFAGETHASYTVWASTDMVEWIPIGKSSLDQTGLMGFTDQSWTNFTRRFYRLSWP
jgi:hypothetical protein